MQKIVIWSDSDWCDMSELEDYLTFKSDDYCIVDVPDFLIDEDDFLYFVFLVANGYYHVA